MASFNFYLKRPKSENTTIYILYDDGVNSTKLYTQESIDPKNWNFDRKEARKSLSGFSDFNEKLKRIKEKCVNLRIELTKDGKFTTELLRERFKAYINELNNRNKIPVSPNDNSTFERFIDFAKHYINVPSTKTKNTLKSNKHTITILQEFEKTSKKKLTFENITLEFYDEFVGFLTKTKQFSPNNIGSHIANIKMFMNAATERGINTNLDFKKKKFKTLTEEVYNIYVNESELIKIYNYDLSNKLRLEHTRDLFIIGCWTGLRFSDFSQLKIENISDGNFKVRTQKTGEPVTIPIHPTVRAILEKYSKTELGLPRTISNQKMNDYLKEIGELAGINDLILRKQTKGGKIVEYRNQKFELITTHTARRSFATNLFLSGFPSISIMKITGHKTEKSFMKYIKVSQEENAKLLEMHWKGKSMETIQTRK